MEYVAFLFLAVVTVAFGFGAYVTGQMALDEWSKIQEIKSEDFIYFNIKSVAERDVKTTEEVRDFLNTLDHAKRGADKVFKGKYANSDQEELSRLRKVNDYTFRIFRDLWFIQSDWHARNGRYFQGKETIPNFPRLGKNSAVEYGFGLTDQVENWRDVGYGDKYAPVSLRSDVYSGPEGDGYIITMTFLVGDKKWTIFMHEGPEDRGESFVWQEIE